MLGPLLQSHLLQSHQVRYDGCCCDDWSMTGLRLVCDWCCDWAAPPPPPRAPEERGGTISRQSTIRILSMPLCCRRYRHSAWATRLSPVNCQRPPNKLLAACCSGMLACIRIPLRLASACQSPHLQDHPPTTTNCCSSTPRGNLAPSRHAASQGCPREGCAEQDTLSI